MSVSFCRMWGKLLACHKLRASEQLAPHCAQPMNRLCLVIGSVLALAWHSGCGPEQQRAAPVANVKGTVHIDRKPIPSGEIHFGMIGVPPRVLQIKDGAFSGEAPVGKNQVEVFVYAEGPPAAKYGGTRAKINTTPERYWGPKTTLSANVEARGTNEFKFDITSK